MLLVHTGNRKERSSKNIPITPAPTLVILFLVPFSVHCDCDFRYSATCCLVNNTTYSMFTSLRSATRAMIGVLCMLSWPNLRMLITNIAPAQQPQQTNFDDYLDLPTSGKSDGDLPKKKTAVVWTTKGIFDECEATRVRHLVETSPAGMDVWIMTNPSDQLNETARNVSLSYIQSIPGLMHIHQNRHGLSDEAIEAFNTWSGTSKSSFVHFLATHNQTYDYGWQIEDDVFYTGPWRDLLQHENYKETDLVSPLVMPVRKKRWSTGRGCRDYGRSCAVNGTKYQVGWPIIRLSARMASAFWTGLEDGNIKGHHEAITYPFIDHRNFSYERIDQSQISKMSLGNGFDGITDLRNNKRVKPGKILHAVKCRNYHNITLAPQDFREFAQLPSQHRN